MNLRTAAYRHFAPLLLTDEAGVSRLVDRLERKGFLRRLPNRHDRRALLLELTSVGRAIVARMRRLREMANRRLHAGLSEDEIAAVRTALMRILDNVARAPQVLR